MILSSQVLLLLGLLLLWIYIFRLRSDSIDRILFFIAGIVGVIFILNPQITTHIANFIGIGRGTDLMLYLFILASLFYVAAMNTRHRRLKRQMTLIVRALALQSPLYGANEKEKTDGSQQR